MTDADHALQTAREMYDARRFVDASWWLATARRLLRAERSPVVAR